MFVSRLGARVGGGLLRGSAGTTSRQLQLTGPGLKRAMKKHDLRVPVSAVNMLEGKKAILQEIAKRDPSHYTAFNPVVGASVGAHMRHSLDHFNKLLAEKGLPEGVQVHYDRRDRHTKVESDIAAALDTIESLKSQVAKLTDADMHTPIKPYFMLEVRGLEHDFASNVERELFFCTHHAVHHMAMIALILKQYGGYESVLDLDTVGRAPSTQYDDHQSKS